jgi:hypothetical protein
MVAILAMHVAALAMFSAPWYCIPLTVFMIGGGICLVVTTGVVAGKVIKAITPVEKDPFCELVGGLVVFYTVLVIAMEIVATGMCIPEIWR